MSVKATEVLKSVVSTPGGVSVQLWVIVAVAAVALYSMFTGMESFMDSKLEASNTKVAQLEGSIVQLRKDIAQDVKSELDSRKAGDTAAEGMDDPVTEGRGHIDGLATRSLKDLVAEWNAGG